MIVRVALIIEVLLYDDPQLFFIDDFVAVLLYMTCDFWPLLFILLAMWFPFEPNPPQAVEQLALIPKQVRGERWRGEQSPFTHCFTL